ncbi:hypothetical protein X801_01573, partial [Opisthorchis viverrini]
MYDQQQQIATLRKIIQDIDGKSVRRSFNGNGVVHRLALGQTVRNLENSKGKLAVKSHSLMDVSPS